MKMCRTCHKPICGHSDAEYQGVVAALARAKAISQQRAILAAMGVKLDTESSRPVSHLTDRTSSGGAALSRPASVVGGR